MGELKNILNQSEVSFSNKLDIQMITKTNPPKICPANPFVRPPIKTTAETYVKIYVLLKLGVPEIVSQFDLQKICLVSSPL